MKAYVATTGVVFALLVVAHVWRVAVEGPHLMHEHSWVVITLLAAALSAWAFTLLWRARRP